ncbi:MAG: AtpZ/AtpI family protein [Rickettsiales bacterium]|nr:AtpZ/AtpI family protein [Pseudomonadota bacterium]MDA0967153.1 AtpZ/AtpI family protein [Pseudomonadota bacterium]MDG4544338.1 AtpZ/AtpI family protein [Rickettsiales bacterium]MDG4546468.1 AtpZ/AtpI family protein [Rickettsiales bacterium]MDG4548614.1 AtpZ/AtpI family protein [Rickettsiales bacterium]
MSDEEDLPSLQELDKSIKEAKKRAEGGDSQANKSGSAFRTSIDLVAGVVVGSVAGYYIDKWLGTLPVFFIVCFFLGVAGSALNIYRSIQRDNNKDS